MGLDPAAIQQQLKSGSTTSKASLASSSSSSSSSANVDFTQLQTHGYCPQEVAAGMAAKARCMQAMAGAR
jgi:hypothetical protein